MLRRALQADHRRAKVRAAEYLLALDYPQDVVEVFTKELADHRGEPGYRIGIWRVLARAANSQKQRDPWLAQIRDVFLDLDAPDRLQAVKTLAELGYKIRQPAEEEAERATSEKETFQRAARAASGPLAAYAARVLANSGEELGEAPPEDELAEHATPGSAAGRRQTCEKLAHIGTNDDLPFLIGLMDDEDPEVRIAAAGAVLRIGRRVPRQMAVVDWIVIAAYALGMLAVGWYYSRRTATTEDYLLGGRNMNPVTVGLSLFATLLSTISYLSIPGEMIRHGPMILCTYLAYPFIFLVAGWWIIPRIIKVRVTSAYEILELRLGLSVRLIGSVLFLALRLLWMAVIIYATAGTVLVPLLGLEASATPYVCAVMGLITVIYTSMGGLRAVVFTDVVQTLILFGGAMLTVALITIHFGGVSAWWPTEWAAHWQEPRFGYDPTVRITLVGAFMAQFTWWVCTAGSDQMAVQRYLATRDLKAARNVLGTSFIANVLVGALLAVLGLALLAYFQTNPHLIPDGQTLRSDADRLFPRFIVSGLPTGVSGLVVAGLLAAAMSSLSSGINSSGSVITVDFVDRFRRGKETETDHVRLAKYTSVLVGVIVVLLSSVVGMVQGNLLEIAFKVVNLLTAPLFGLFFMALFIRWATAPGTIVGLICGLVVVTTINYWTELTGRTDGISFLWAMPLSFLAQASVGMLVSLLPFGQRRPPLPE